MLKVYLIKMLKVYLIKMLKVYLIKMLKIQPNLLTEELVKFTYYKEFYSNCTCIIIYKNYFCQNDHSPLELFGILSVFLSDASSPVTFVKSAASSPVQYIVT